MLCQAYATLRAIPTYNPRKSLDVPKERGQESSEPIYSDSIGY